MANSTLVQKTFQDNDMMRLFNQMIGVGDPDPVIVVPKIQNILKSCDTILSVLEKSFVQSPLGKLLARHFPNDVRDVEAFCAKGRQAIATHQLEKNDGVQVELAELNRDHQKLMDFIRTAQFDVRTDGLGEKYNSLKESALIQGCVMTLRLFKEALNEEQMRVAARNPAAKTAATPSKAAKNETSATKAANPKTAADPVASPASSPAPKTAAAKAPKAAKTAKDEAPAPLPHCLSDKDSLSLAFITDAAGDSLCLFSFSRLDFKQLYLRGLLDAPLTKYLLTSLFILHRELRAVVGFITSPNVNVEELGEVIISNIGSIQKQLPGCEKAFKKIGDSLDLFKSNFDGYYKDFLSANSNPVSILESFVHDVAESNKGDRQTVIQFGKIIRFYNERMKVSGNKDPLLAKMMAKAQEQMSLLEEQSAKKERAAAKEAATQ